MKLIEHDNGTYSLRCDKDELSIVVSTLSHVSSEKSVNDLLCQIEDDELFDDSIFDTMKSKIEGIIYSGDTIIDAGMYLIRDKNNV